MAFGVHFREESAETELKAVIQKIREGKAPRMWHITPDATPHNIIDIMKKNGFKDLSERAPFPEPAMSLHKCDFIPFPEESSPVVCHRVCTREDFEAWIDVVNTALNGWEMIDAEHYFAWVESGRLKIYSGKINGTTVSTCATIQNGSTASLEFVSTLEQYRRKKAAAHLCSFAIKDLLENGVETVTLGACGQSVHLYEKLGFKKCFNNIVMRYDL